MRPQSRYTADEWNLLTNAPFLIGSAVAASSPSGVVGTLKEGAALATSSRKVTQQHANNELIQGASSKSIDPQAWMQAAQTIMQGKDVERVQYDGLETCRELSQILAMKSPPQEANDYKEWLMQIGENVARAANEGGGFLNRGGVQISEGEQRILTQMASELGVMH